MEEPCFFHFRRKQKTLQNSWISKEEMNFRVGVKISSYFWNYSGFFLWFYWNNIKKKKPRLGVRQAQAWVFPLSGWRAWSKQIHLTHFAYQIVLILRPTSQSSGRLNEYMLGTVGTYILIIWMISNSFRWEFGGKEAFRSGHVTFMWSGFELSFKAYSL